MKRPGYGQYCGLARAAEKIGERWTLLILRDLLVGPKRFTDLLSGLPRIPTNVLTSRLGELEDAGIIQRRALARPSKSVVYELTQRGHDVEPAIVALGRWGARQLGDPLPGEIVTGDSLVMALRSTFQPAAAKATTVSYEVSFGEILVHARVSRGKLTAAKGALPEADLRIEAGPAFRALLAGEIAPQTALKTNAIGIRGDAALLERFVELFRIV